MRPTVISIVIMLLLIACSGVEQVSGQLPSPDRLRTIDIGQSKRADIRRLLGPPSIIPIFDQTHWYYTRKITTTFAFEHPNTIEQRVLTITFDKDDIVSAIDFSSDSETFDVALSDRTTPSRGRVLSVWEQLLSSYGRLPTPTATGAGTLPRRQ